MSQLSFHLALLVAVLVEGEGSEAEIPLSKPDTVSACCASQWQFGAQAGVRERVD